MDEETTKRIQNLQSLEQDFQQIIMQKQNFQLELNETSTAIEEIEKTNSDIFRVVGQVMIKSNKEILKKDLIKKQEILSTRVKAIEKQELSLRENIERIRHELVSKIQ
jgi:prefoldin beta subunit